jgi:hypothetical protein
LGGGGWQIGEYICQLNFGQKNERERKNGKCTIKRKRKEYSGDIKVNKSKMIAKTGQI